MFRLFISRLAQGKNPFVGDSADPAFMNKFNSFIDKLETFKEGNEKFTVIIDDVLSNM